MSFDMSLAPYIIAGAIVIIISIVGLTSDSISRGMRWIIVGLGFLIGIGIVAAIISGGFTFILNGFSF